MTDPVAEYDNGPLPASLASRAYFTRDRREWALSRPDALVYLEWCAARGMEVLGWEAWYPTVPSPTVLTGVAFDGVGADANRDALLAQLGEEPPVVYNIVARRKGPAC